MSDLENLVHNAFAEMQYPKASAELAELKLSRRQWEETATLYAQNSADKDATIAQLRTELDVACHVKANDKVDFDFAVLEEITICRGVILTLRADLDEAIRVIEELTHPLDYDIQFAHAATFLERVKHGGDA